MYERQKERQKSEKFVWALLSLLAAPHWSVLASSGTTEV